MVIIPKAKNIDDPNITANHRNHSHIGEDMTIKKIINMNNDKIALIASTIKDAKTIKPIAAKIINTINETKASTTIHAYMIRNPTRIHPNSARYHQSLGVFHQLVNVFIFQQ